MMKNKHKMETYIQWKINSGNCSFWWDDWLGVGPLANFRDVSCRLNNSKVADFIVDGQWNVGLISQVAPPQYVPAILAIHLQIQQRVPDQPIWKLSTSGVFSCASAWNVIREHRNKTKINSYTWHKCIPFKCSFLLWRALKGKLPTNEKLATFVLLLKSVTVVTHLEWIP